jgi:hypothetical protein
MRTEQEEGGKRVGETGSVLSHVLQTRIDEDSDENTIWEIINQVPQAIEISSKGNEPTRLIPPFGRVTISQHELDDYLLEEDGYPGERASVPVAGLDASYPRRNTPTGTACFQ